MKCPDCGHQTLDNDVCGQFCQNPNCSFDRRTVPEVSFEKI
jgi:hypothetical protein